MPAKPVYIAIADDIPLLRTGLALILNAQHSCNVIIEAENGRDLLDKIESAATKPDICLLDISMPVMDGYETLISLRKSWPQIKVVILSVHYNEYTIIRTIREGACCCLPKEINISDLIKIILEINEHGFYNTQLVNQKIIATIRQDANRHKFTLHHLAFLRLCCSDLTYKEIAAHMKLSPKTIDGYRDELFTKLDTKSRVGLVLFAIQAGIYSEFTGTLF